MLDNNTQIAVKEESVKGVAESLSAADAGLLVIDPAVSPDFTLYERNPVRATLSSMAPLTGIKKGKLSFSHELIGSGTLGVAPDWFRLMRGGGYKQYSLVSLNIGAISSGPFKNAELITGGTSGATGLVVKETVDGASSILIAVLTGTFQDTDVLSGSISGASATASSSPADAGIGLKPTSKENEVPCLTWAAYKDGRILKFKGGQANVKFMFDAGEPSKVDFEILGVYDSDIDGDLLTGVEPPELDPPILLDANFTVDAYAADFNQMEITMGNTVTAIATVNDSSGVNHFRISKRKVVGSFNPVMVTKAVHDFWGKWINNTPMPMSFKVGNTPGNQFEFYIPRVVYTNVEESSQDGLIIANVSFSLTGVINSSDDEMWIIAA